MVNVNAFGGGERTNAIYGGLGVRPALFSDGEQNYSVRRPQINRILCNMSTLTVISTVTMQLVAASACAPLSSRREQNYKRSPASDSSLGVYNVDLRLIIGGTSGSSGGNGVRPALFSEGTEL